LVQDVIITIDVSNQEDIISLDDSSKNGTFYHGYHVQTNPECHTGSTLTGTTREEITVIIPWVCVSKGEIDKAS